VFHLLACPARLSLLQRISPLNRSIPLVLAVALFMEHMDSTVISTALPAIARYRHDADLR
jgi:hypothetical protein